MTPLQWAIVDVLTAERQGMLADEIAVKLRAQGRKGTEGVHLGAALAALRERHLVLKRSLPAGHIVVRGERVRQFKNVWIMNPEAELPARQESLL